MIKSVHIFNRKSTLFFDTSGYNFFIGFYIESLERFICTEYDLRPENNLNSGFNLVETCTGLITSDIAEFLYVSNILSQKLVVHDFNVVMFGSFDSIAGC